jgi:hypothetical protein
LRRRATDCFNTEPGIDQRITETGERGATRACRAVRSEPDQRQPHRFDEHGREGNFGPTQLVGDVPEEQARGD